MGFTQQFGFIEHGWCVFRQTFTGNGSATTFQLTSNVGNAVFKSGAWDIQYVQTTYASDVTKTTRAALYDSALPLTRHKISISSISATGLVTLDYAPQAENFFIWYWYDLAGTQVLDEYYRDDFVNAMEADSGVTIASGITLDTSAFNGLLSATQDTVQKAMDLLDDHGHPQSAITGLTTASSPVFVTVKLSGLTDLYVPYHVADATGLADTTLKIIGSDFLWMISGGDAYPAFSIHAGNHDLAGISFDAYYDGAKWVSCDPGSNFVMYKTLDCMTYYYAAGIAQGSEITTWIPVFEFTNAGSMNIYGDTSDTPTRGWISFGLSYDTTAFAAADNNVSCNKFRLYDSAGWMCGMGVSDSCYNIMTGTYFKFLCGYTGTGTGYSTMVMSAGLVAVGTITSLPVKTFEVQAAGAATARIMGGAGASIRVEGTTTASVGCTSTTTSSYEYFYLGEVAETTPVYLVRWNSAFATRPQDFDIVNTLADVNIQGTAIQVARFTGAAGMSTVAVGITGSKPGTLMLYGNGYLNFGTVEGTTGYGIRNNTGYVQVKHSDYEDTWEDIERTHEISKAVVLVDDFFGPASAPAFKLGWSCGYSGTGAVVTSIGFADGVHLGSAHLQTGTTTTGYAGIGLPYLNDSPIPGGDLKVEFIVRSGTLSDVTDTYKVLVGLADVYDGTAPADGIYFTYAYTESGGSWECITCHDSTETTTDSAKDVAANTFYRLGFVMSADGLTVKFYIDDALVATHTTNIPGASDGCGPVASIIKSAGTTDRSLSVDAFYLRKRVVR